ncbi:MAG TPA: Re/Si-specific NAD(P)(+) transhydrogenase subunit alpha [Candidatus Dormibacteraeota bacterium]|jgi:NAD(P) transhydrogenase subunit alpha|nr:Re/Si-specific NAD(P)(+) transhydrogenase subunit alpha [Candidatus Dormibacteraeota bacterium]
MTIKVVVLTEEMAGERRVALVPEGVRKLCSLGLEVAVQKGAGGGALIDDDAYLAAGGTVDTDLAHLLSGADVVLAVQAPVPTAIAQLPKGAVVISFLQPSTQADAIRSMVGAGVTGVSLDLVPRISRAQSMDALSSQAGVSGYHAVLVAAVRLPKFFPMLMTAAGTIPPARVLVLGAGVAGLQAIATSRRLGAVVEAFDVRPAVRDEVKSLGAKFLELELDTEQAEGAGGYAREQSEEFLAKQRELIGAAVAQSDVVITTAAIPGRQAPVLVTAAMVKAMRPGSVIVDLAAESGGNCESSRSGEEIRIGEVLVYGARNMPSQMPLHASQLYSRNISSLLELMFKGGGSALSLEDDVLKAACVVIDGQVVNDRARELLESAS